MPRGDGTGPTGQGPATGRGMGRGGAGGAAGAAAGGRGRMGGTAAGLGGACVCPSCGHKIPHQRATPCTQIKCPNCGQMMARGT